jgi:nucleotide-binding universal stress UspA family protein
MEFEDNSLIFPLRRIVVALDGSENAKRAARAAIALSKQNDSELVALCAVTSPIHVVTSSTQSYIPDIDYSGEKYEASVSKANSVVDEIVREAKEQGVTARGLVDTSVSSTAEAIVNQAINLHADLIVVGTRGLGGFKRIMLGSVSTGVVTHADCSVLVVR